MKLDKQFENKMDLFCFSDIKKDVWLSEEICGFLFKQNYRHIHTVLETLMLTELHILREFSSSDWEAPS